MDFFSLFVKVEVYKYIELQWSQCENYSKKIIVTRRHVQANWQWSANKQQLRHLLLNFKLLPSVFSKMQSVKAQLRRLTRRDLHSMLQPSARIRCLMRRRRKAVSNIASLQISASSEQLSPECSDYTSVKADWVLIKLILI